MKSVDPDAPTIASPERPDILDHVMQSSPIGICLVDSDFRYTKINQSLAQFNGLSIEAHIGRGLRAVVPGVAAILEPIYRQVFATGEPVLDLPGSGAPQGSAGPEKSWLASYYPIRSATGAVEAVSAAVRDTTGGGQSDSDADAIAPPQFLCTIVDQLPGLFFVVDEEQRFILWSRHLAFTSGYTDSELASMRADHDLLTPADRPRVAAALAAARQIGMASVQFDLVARGGRRIPHRAAVRRLKLGDRTCIVGMGLDVSAQLAVQDALRQERDRAQTLLDIAGVLIVFVGADGRVVALNRKGCEVLECEESGAIGLDWFNEFLPDEVRAPVRAMFDRLMTGEVEPIEYFENPVLTVTGRQRLIAWRNALVRDRDGSIVGTLSSGEDITESRRAEDALRSSETALRQSHEQIQDLAGRLLGAQEEERRRIARELHDGLNQTLALLAVELEWLGQRSSASPAEIATQVGNMCARVRELSSDVHRLSHRLHPAQLEYLGLVAAIGSLCDALVAKHGIEVDFARPAELPALPQDVALCLYRVTQESLQNAVRHSGAGKVRVELAAVAGETRLVIADAGVGFVVDRVGEKGGLGLVSMEERLRLVGGALTIKSEPARGTEIEARVPLLVTVLAR